MQKRCMVLLIFLVSSFLAAQTEKGVIRGTVTDSQGAVVVQASVTAINIATRVESSSTTNQVGDYNIPALEPGIYEVVFKATGFKTLNRENVMATLGNVTGLNIVLDVGSETQTITVSTAGPDIKVEQSDVSTEVPTEAYSELPLSAGGGRSAGNFRNLVAGVNAGSTNGGEANSGEFQVDGITAQIAGEYGNGGNIRFAPDAVQEMSLETSSYSAEYGQTGNGVERYVIKSGTNQFHGSAYEYLKNTALDAMGYFNTTTPVDRQNEFGFTFGGPVLLPHIYEGRNRTFFFINGNFYRTTGGGAEWTMSLPNDAFRNGDFSAVLAQGQVVYDPATTRVGPNGEVIRDPFPNNQIPTSRFNQTALNILSYVPHSTTQDVLVNTFLPGSKSYSHTNTIDFKVDHTISPKHHLNFTYLRTAYPNSPGSSPVAQPIAYSPIQFYEADYQVRVNYDWTIRNNMLNQLRLGYNRQFPRQTTSDYNGNWPSKLGMTGFQPSGGFFPQIGWGSYFPLAVNHYLDDPVSNTYVISDALSWSLSRHNLKFGTELRNPRFWITLQQASYMWFSRNETADPQNLGPTGSEIASFLLGYVDYADMHLQEQYPSNTHWNYYDFYAQDDYRINSRLTINYGLRFGIMTPIEESHDYLSIMDQSEPNSSAGGLLGSYIFAGKNGQGSRIGYGTTDSKNIQPRIGLAYKLSEKTAIRAGYGISNFPTGIYAGGASNNDLDGYWITSQASSPDGYSPAFTLADGFPQNDIQSQNLTSSMYLGSGFDFWDKTAYRSGQSQSWNLSVQREIAPNTTVEIAYVGQKGTYLPLQANLNQVSPGYLSLGDNVLRSNINSTAAIAAGVSAPWSGFSSLLGTSATVAQALRPYPQYLSGLGAGTQNYGDSTYHGLQLKFERRFSNGLWAMANYTWSKGLNDANQAVTTNAPYTIRNVYNPRMDKTVGQYSQPQLFHAAFTYDLPFGEHRRFLNGNNFVTKYVLGGWRLSGILTYGSGGNFGIGAPNNLPIFAGGATADIVPGQPYKAHWSGKFNPHTDKFLNVNAFTLPANDTFGNSKPIIDGLRGFASQDEDLSLTRITPITERVKLELKVEAFNAFNRTIFGGQLTDITNPSVFGEVTAQANSPRNAQVVGRITF